MYVEKQNMSHEDVLNDPDVKIYLALNEKVCDGDMDKLDKKLRARDELTDSEKVYTEARARAYMVRDKYHGMSVVNGKSKYDRLPYNKCSLFLQNI